MADVPPEVAALLEQARQGHDPSEADQERVHRSLVLALAAPALVAGTAGGTAGSAGTAAGGAGSISIAPGPVVAAGVGKAGLTLGAKVALGSLVLAGLGGAVAVLPRAPAKDLNAARVTASQPAHHTESRVAGATPQALPPSAVPAAAEPVTTASAEPGLEAAAERPGSRAHRAERAQHEAHAHDVQAAVSTPVAATDPEPVDAHEASLGVSALEELKLIRLATRQLRDGDARSALATLKEHAVRHPDGALGLERDGLRVLALCAVDPNGEARALRAKFLDQHGASTMALRVRAACEPNGGEPGAAP